MTKRWFVGAYAAVTHLQPWNPIVQGQFWAALAECPEVRGLELPLPASDEEWLSLPRQWEFIITLLPHTMQALALNPQFGLASPDEEGFRAALALAERARLAVHFLERLCGRAAVRAVHLHSAPQMGHADPKRLSLALKELRQRDWGGAALVLEHCDAYRPPPHQSIKGFLPLDAELDVGLGMTLNWGRSAIEWRRASAALEQLRMVKAKDASQLKGFMFSGTAIADPLYGDWQDSHAPIALGSKEKWEPSGGLLNLAAIRELRPFLQDEKLLLGLKVQFFPRELTFDERISALKDQLCALETLWSE